MKVPYGYYVFLGNGDYHKPENINGNWTSTWKLKEWKDFLQGIVKLNANTLMIYLNGHYLPYQSAAFPELVQTDHPNVQKEFLSQVLMLAKSYGINLIAVFTTTGHTGKYLENNSELGIKIRSHNINLEKLLCPFPEHIKKIKNKKQKGSAQVGFGILCHNNPLSQAYAFKLIKEGLTTYNQFDGIALHPPEAIYACFCDYCCQIFQNKYNKDLLMTSDDEAREFYLESYLDFQAVLENEIRSCTSKQLYTFTVPWLFESSFEKIANKIPKDTILIDWDYNLNLSRIYHLKIRLTRYQKFGHHVWFMPTAGFGINQNQNIQKQLNKVKKQIRFAIDANVEGIVHFVGPYFSMELKETNYSEEKLAKPSPHETIRLGWGR